LGLQVKTLEDPGAAVDGLTALVTSQPAYASAWITLSFSAERAGLETRALKAARRSAELWGSKQWVQRVSDLEDRWIGSRLRRAEEAIAAGNGHDAAKLARAALTAEPGDRRATLILVRSKLLMGDDEGALHLVRDLGRDPDALLIEASIAERREEWTRALELYQELPDTDPRKRASLERVKRRWRITNLPEYVQEALRSTALTRDELAILVPNLLPELLALPTRNVPVISDIVDLPSQREIVTMVAVGLMRADPIEHTFNPQGRLDATEVRRILEGAARRTERAPPRWCSSASKRENCFVISDPPSGRDVATVLNAMEEVHAHE